MELDDDDDSLESMVDPSGAVKDAHMNSDLYDAFANPGTSHGTTFIPHSNPPVLSAVLRYTSRGLGSSARHLPRWMSPTIPRHSAIRATAHPSTNHPVPPGPLSNGARSDAKVITLSQAVTQKWTTLRRRQRGRQHRAHLHMLLHNKRRRVCHPAGSSHPAVRDYRGAPSPRAPPLVPVTYKHGHRHGYEGSCNAERALEPGIGDNNGLDTSSRRSVGPTHVPLWAAKQQHVSPTAPASTCRPL